MNKRETILNCTFGKMIRTYYKRGFAQFCSKGSIANKKKKGLKHVHKNSHESLMGLCKVHSL